MRGEQEDQDFKKSTEVIISFVSSEQSKKTNKFKENQKQSQKLTSLSLVSDCLNLLTSEINNNNKCLEVIKIPNFLCSLIILFRYKRNIHSIKKEDDLTYQIRDRSRECLNAIHCFGDISVQNELSNVQYACAMTISISTADGSGEQDDYEIYQGLFQITDSLKQLREGRSHYSPSFPPQTALTKTFEEQIEEEGGNEAVDSQLVNKRIGNNILDEADKTKGYILNFYIDRINHKPWWYYRI